MLKMQYVAVMAMILMGIVCGLATSFLFWVFICVVTVSLTLTHQLIILQVELAHGGRGHSSSSDRYSSYGGGRGGRGVSRRSDYRGLYISYRNHIHCYMDTMVIKLFTSCLQYWSLDYPRQLHGKILRWELVFLFVSIFGCSPPLHLSFSPSHFLPFFMHIRGPSLTLSLLVLMVS